MRDLLPHFERELAFLSRHAEEFGKAYPHIAGRLSTSGNLLEDPHVERLVQSFALLASRVHKRLDDDFPRFTEALLQVLYPHYLRPFPSCSIAAFVLGAGAAQLTATSTVPRGTVLQTRAVRNVPCRFVTATDVRLAPVRVVSARWRGTATAPDGTQLPAGSSSVMSLTLEILSPQLRWADLADQPLRVYLDGDTSQITALREAMLGRVLGGLLQTSIFGPWRSLPNTAPQLVGFGEDEALLPMEARAHPAYRLLTEYFAFPEKFNFLDLPLNAEALAGASRQITLHYAMAGLRSDSDEARLLESVSESQFVLGCTPVVNVFAQRAEPIRLTHSASEYPVLPDARRAYAFEVYSVERVFRVRKSPEGETVQAFRPFYSLQHDELLADGEGAGRYWHAHRNDTLSERSPGHETLLSLVDIGFDPAAPQSDTLSVEVMATNRDLPSQISIGQSGGDLFLDGGSVASEIRLLRKPTRSERFERGQGALWRLISHLSLNHLSVTGAGIDGLKELLRLYDLPRSSGTRRIVDGLVAVECLPATAWLPGNPFATFVRGIKVQMTVDEQAFVGSGLRLFAQVMNHFFGLYVHANSFVQFELLSARTRETLVKLEQRSGEGALL